MEYKAISIANILRPELFLLAFCIAWVLGVKIIHTDKCIGVTARLKKLNAGVQTYRTTFFSLLRHTDHTKEGNTDRRGLFISFLPVCSFLV